MRLDHYTPVSDSELNDLALTGDALQLLLRLRAFSDANLTDGLLSPRQCAAVRALHGVSPPKWRSCLANLIRSGHVSEELGTVFDIGFLRVCKPSATRQDEKEAWRIAKANWRAQKSGPDTIQPVLTGQPPLSDPESDGTSSVGVGKGVGDGDSEDKLVEVERNGHRPNASDDAMAADMAAEFAD